MTVYSVHNKCMQRVFHFVFVILSVFNLSKCINPSYIWERELLLSAKCFCFISDEDMSLSLPLEVVCYCSDGIIELKHTKATRPHWNCRNCVIPCLCHDFVKPHDMKS
jgi:hypothetical protein